ncbi:class I SAM-dependent methyltransferase [Dactylosporangium darangshiense]|uniref:Methyltransferase domain-containing protein n=1 Tax=Dactylosporangium darangshiense TaxID=579108 RepID=A0ABP8DT71_9ACTN
MAAGLDYAFSNDDPEAVDRHQFLAAMLDPATRERLAGLGPLAGRRCLELGAGGGSVAAWLAAEAGPAGRVLATDINLRHLPDGAAYETLRHDLRSEPVPPGPWDLIHARLVLLHIPDREDILRRLAAALAPGGALVLEEWSTTTLNPGLVLSAPSVRARELVEEYHRTLITDVLPARGNDPSWAPRLHRAMEDAGLTGVTTRISADSWPGGSPGARLIHANVAQLRDDFLAAGFTPERLDELRDVVHDPRLVLRSHLLYSTAGRRP